MSSTTTSRATTPRAATAATVGGVLWALVPIVFSLPEPSHISGTLEFAAVAVVSWLCGAVSLVLLIAGVLGLRSTLGAAAGRLGTSGIVVSTIGLAAMLVGMGTELLTTTISGTENDRGHTVFLIGFLVLIVGQILLGITVFRRRPERLARAGALLMALALPVGVALVLLGGVLFPGSDAGFWAGMTIPTGVAWLLVGRAMATGRTASPAEPARI